MDKEEIEKLIDEKINKLRVDLEIYYCKRIEEMKNEM